MRITNAARRFEQRFDAKAERFIWHHPLLGSISIFVGMPLLGFGVCLYQYDRYRLSYGMAFGLVVIFISSLNTQKITNAIFRGKVL